MKLDGLALPPRVAQLVAAACSDPPEGSRERVRQRLAWAFIESGAEKVVYVRQRAPLHAVYLPARHGLDRWTGALGRVAAALTLGKVSLAVAGLSVAVAVVPVTRGLLSRSEEIQRKSHDKPPAHKAHASHFTQQPSLSMAPSAPALAPLPEAFPIPPTTESQGSATASVSPPAEARNVRPEPPGEDQALAAERELLVGARQDLAQGDPRGALARLDVHQARYPASQLAEEREALYIQSLVASGRVGDARFRDGEFRRRFPHSLFLPALDAALHE
jgi:hypothetical protein